MSIDFYELLGKAGMSKAAFARRLGLSPDTVTRWGNSPPQYAIAYLELYISVKENCDKILK